MLKHIQVVNASAAAKPYQLSDGNGLFLRIMPSGRKLWIVSKSINGERISKEMWHYAKKKAQSNELTLSAYISYLIVKDYKCDDCNKI